MWNWVRFRLPQSLTAFAPIFALLIVVFGEITVPGIIRTVGAVMYDAITLNESVFNIGLYLAFGVLNLVGSIIWFIFILAVLWFIFTLVNPPLNNPIVRAIWFLIDPLLTPIQRYMPRTQLDLSPVVLAALAFVFEFLVGRLMVPVQSSLLI